MVKKKTKKKRRVGKRISERHLLFFSIILAATTTFALFRYISSSTSASSPPIFEETYAKTSHFKKEITKIDEIIYQSLYGERIPDERIFFVKVKPRYQKTVHWDFTEMLVALPDKDSAVRLNETISAELSPLTPKIRYRTERTTNKEITGHIFAIDSYTHKIRLTWKQSQKASRSPLPKIALIIDDLGYDRRIAGAFMDLNLPLGLSVLPIAPHTKTVVQDAKKSGHELILHLPMEPNNVPGINPGPGVLLTGMKEHEIITRINEHFRTIPGLKGVNNHMGSLFTSRGDKMAVVMREIKKRGLFYIDSRTTTQTQAFDLAKEIGVPVAKRNVFLDNDLSPNAIKIQMHRLMGIARHSGVAIGIGHPHSETLRLLKRYLQKLNTEYQVVPVSELVG